MFDTQTFYRAKCDQCETTWHGSEYDYWQEPWMADEAADHDGWQISRHPDGTILHRCPQHWRTTCTQCGLTAVGTQNQLEEADWQNIDTPPLTLCKECAKAKQS